MKNLPNLGKLLRERKKSNLQNPKDSRSERKESEPWLINLVKNLVTA
jgi:hypothetical protein